MPIVISGGMLLSADDSQLYPAKNPRIGYDNLLTKSTTVLTSTTEAPGYEKENLTDYFSWTYWQSADFPAQLTVDASAAYSVDYFAIAYHTLYSAGCSITLEYSTNGSSWTELVAPYFPDSDAPLMFIFDAVSARYYRVSLANVSADAPAQIAVINIGKTLVVPHSIYVGHTPITLSRETEIRPNRTEGGQWVGRSIVRRGNNANVELTHLSASWYREKFELFVEHAISYPFFFAWRPDEYPMEIGFGWTNSDIRPNNTGPGNMMSVSFDINGLAQ